MRIKKIGRSIPIILALYIILAFSAFAAGEPVILSQPQNVYLPDDTTYPVTLTFSVLAQGDGELSYQWQISTNGSYFSNIASTNATSTTPNLRIPQTEEQIDNRWFRCIVTNSSGSVTSSVVTSVVQGLSMDSLGQYLGWVGETANSIFDWVGQTCVAITGTPLLLFSVGFLALGGAIAIVSRLLARS